MLKKSIITLIILTIALPIFASNSNYKLETTGSVPPSPILKKIMFLRVGELDSIGGINTVYSYPDEDVDVLYTNRLDSMTNTWFVDNYYGYTPQPGDTLFQFAGETELTKEQMSQALPDSVYIERLKDLNSMIELSYNPTIKNYIALYSIRRRRLTALMLGLGEYYFPMMEETLDKYNLPLELKYLAIIESAMNPRARSRVGATGLWQFMYKTGKSLDLEISSYVDERCDPIKSTEAAAKFLKQLYDMYGDWHLALAAYNCGPGNVNKAIRRSGGKTNYWEIYYRLPRETRGYLPAMIGAIYSISYAKEHGIQPILPLHPIVTDTIKVHEYVHLQQLATGLELPLKAIQDLNPQYRADIIPASAKKGYNITLPLNKIADYIDHEKQILAIDKSTYFPDNKLSAPTSTTTSYSYGNTSGKDKVRYKVKSGDNIGFISTWFHVRSADIRNWNNVRRNMIRVGQTLSIYVPKGKGTYYSTLNNMSFAQKQASINASTTTTTSKPSTPQENTNGYLTYKIKNGDTLWSISQKYSSVSTSDLLKINGLTSRSKLKIGQVIKIKKT